MKPETLEKREKVRSLCKGRYLTTHQLAEALGLSVHTVRAYYVYPLVRDGRLTLLHPPGPRKDQAYTSV